MAVTIKQIAKMSDVAPATVSLVLQDSPKVSKKTKERVLKIIEEMDYYPNNSGRLLKQGRTNNIAVLSSYFHGIFKMELVNGVETAIYNTPYRLSQFYTESGKEPEKCKEILLGKMADAAMVICMKPEQRYMQKMRSSGKHIILIEDTLDGFPGVRFDNFEGAYSAVKYLASTGRKKIGISVSNLQENVIHSFVDDRLSGYKAALKDSGLAFNKDYVLITPTYTYEFGIETYRRYKESGLKLDAIFFASGDLCAAAFLKEAQKDGINIPDDIAIVGFDNSIIAAVTSPGLTTIRQPAGDMGKKACEMAVSLLNGSDQFKEQVITFKPELIKRESA